MTNSILLSNSIRGNLVALNLTQSLIDKTTLRLATGLKVSSVFDNPQNFYASQSLLNRASDFSGRLDGIGQNLSAIQQGVSGLEGIERLLNLGKSFATTELERLRGLDEIPIIPNVPLSEQILAANPAAYWRLNETAGGVAQNLGSLGAAVNGTYSGAAQGANALYDDGDLSTRFDGINDRINIPSNPGINQSARDFRTVELVFNADTTAGRQVLYEEGGTTNALSIYILNGQLHVTGRDAGAWGPANISTSIVAGETYHVAFTLDAVAGEFIGYVNGQEIGRDVVTTTFPPHGAAVAIGRMAGGTWFHDGAQNGNNHYFDGRISDVALYNATLTDNTIESHANSVLGLTSTGESLEFNRILDQITQLANDSSYRGLNLLLGDTLTTLFNEDGSSLLETKGQNFTAEALNISRSDFNSIDDLSDIIDELNEAIEDVRRYKQSLANDIKIITTRQTFTESLIETLTKGANKLTITDFSKAVTGLKAGHNHIPLALT